MNLTRNEAEAEMRAGKKVAHDLFLKDEWITSSLDGQTITFENGVSVPASVFWHHRNTECWDKDWRIVD